MDMEMGECDCCVAHFLEEEERNNNDKCVKSPHFVGRHILICGKKNTRFPFHCMVGPHWPVTLFTYSLLIVPSVLFLNNVAVPLDIGVVVVGSITFIAVLLFFSMTACSDPGIVYSPVIKGVPDMEAQSASDANGLMECSKCNVRRPLTATHCYDCGVCIDKLDHHCPWTGKCIGRKNLHFFYGFLVTLMIHIGFVTIVSFYFFVIR